MIDAVYVGPRDPDDPSLMPASREIVRFGRWIVEGLQLQAMPWVAIAGLVLLGLAIIAATVRNRAMKARTKFAIISGIVLLDLVFVIPAAFAWRYM